MLPPLTTQTDYLSGVIVVDIGKIFYQEYPLLIWIVNVDQRFIHELYHAAFLSHKSLSFTKQSNPLSEVKRDRQNSQRHQELTKLRR